MAYAPKPTAPESFNAVDAILSAIHGDPVWGWLEGYAHLYPSSYVSTAWFCDQGPTNAGALNLGDLLNLAPLGTADFFAGEAQIAKKVVGALHDRLFAAMCHTPSSGISSWYDVACLDLPPSGTEAHAFMDGSQEGITVNHRWHLHVDDRTASYIAFGTRLAGAARDVHGGYPLFDGPVAPSDQYWTITWGPFDEIWLYRDVPSVASARLCMQREGIPPDAPYVPTEQPMPDGYVERAIPPTAAVADLAPILFAIELKLEQLLPISAGILTNQLDTGVAATADTVAAPTNTVVDAIGWQGFVVTLDSVPTQANVSFGTPQQYAKLARVNIGTPDGWYPPIQVTVSPMIVRPMPPGADRVSLTVDPPASGTITPILPSG